MDAGAPRRRVRLTLRLSPGKSGHPRKTASGDVGHGRSQRRRSPRITVRGRPGASIARDQLRSIIERIERLEEEKQAIAEDIKEVYAEAKANGYDTKTLRAVVRIRKQDTAERQEQEALLDLYLAALGMAVTAEAAE